MCTYGWQRGVARMLVSRRQMAVQSPPLLETPTAVHFVRLLLIG